MSTRWIFLSIYTSYPILCIMLIITSNTKQLSIEIKFVTMFSFIPTINVMFVCIYKSSHIGYNVYYCLNSFKTHGSFNVRTRHIKHEGHVRSLIRAPQGYRMDMPGNTHLFFVNTLCFFFLAFAWWFKYLMVNLLYITLLLTMSYKQNNTTYIYSPLIKCLAIYFGCMFLIWRTFCKLLRNFHEQVEWI